MLIPEAEFLHSEFYSKYMLSAGFRHRLGIVIDAGERRFLLTFWRQKAQRDFGQEQKESLERLAPFLRSYLRNQRLRLSLESNESAFRELINQYSHGALLIDATLRVVFFNKVAGEYVGSEDALAIRGGQLTAADPADEARFVRMLKASTEAAGKQDIIMLTGTKSGDPVAVSVFGVAREEAASVFVAPTEQPASIVLITKGARSREVGAGDLENLLGFTPQEAQTASLLVAGRGVTEIARELSVSRETVRYFLKGLFWKTGTHNQRELVSFIGTSVPPGIISLERSKSKSNGGD
jgi:DNA-binding NarL/FixJ family response regulator